MKATKAVKFTSLFLMIAFFFTGCFGLSHYNLKVKDDLAFSKREAKKPANMGIYLDSKTRNYVIDVDKGTRYTLAIGKSLEINSVKSLKKVFPEAYLVKETVNPKRLKDVIIIKFGPETTLDPGMSTISQNKGIIQLECEILKRGRKIWGTSIKKTSQRGNPLGYCSPLIFLQATIRANKAEALGEAAHDSLKASLEELNDQILKR
jgi:hypothetical protein